MRKQSFNSWWASMNRPSREQKDTNFHRWLKFACKTVAHRGDHDQQRVVYTIFNRYDKSEHRRISRQNAQRVYRIINTKIDSPPRPQPKPPATTRTVVPVVIRKKTIKRISSGGMGRQKV